MDVTIDFPRSHGLFNGVRGEAGRGAGIMTLAGRAGQGTTVASANWFKFWGQHWPRIWRLLTVVLWITRYEKCGTNDFRGVSDFPGAKLNGWRCWRNTFPNTTTVIPTKIEKCCSRILVRFCVLYFFSGGCFGKIINISCGPSGALTSAAKVPCPSRKTLYCKPDSKVITPAIQDIASLVFYVSLRKYKMQKTIRSFIYIYRYTCI